MAGEAIKVIRGPITKIRAIATADAKEGDYEVIGHAAGFWLHDVTKDETGDFCIGAGVVEARGPVYVAPNDDVAVDPVLAGSSLVHDGNTYKIVVNPNKADQNTPGVVAKVYEGFPKQMGGPSRRGRVLLVWGHH